MWDYIFSALLWLCVCTVILLGVYVHQTYKYWKERGVEFDQPYFPLGNLNFLMRKSFWDYCMELMERFPRDYVGIYLGLKPALVVQTPELARVVLTKDFEYFNNRYLYSNQSDPLGALNLFTVNNPIWRDVRHELSPMFTGHRLKLVTELMNQNSKELAKKIQRDFVEKNNNVNLKDHIPMNTINVLLDEAVSKSPNMKPPLWVHTELGSYRIQELFSMYTSDTVAYTVFGIRVSILNDQPSPLWFITRNMVHFTFWRGLEFTLVFLMPALAAFLRLKFFSEAATDFIKKMFWTVVDERKDVRNPNDKDLVNHLLQLKENLKLPVHDHSDPEMADKLMLAQAAVFILGSVETSSTTLSYLMHELAHHPEEQETLYEEIRQTLAKTGGDVLQYQELMEMKYLSACMYETLRKYPPVSYLDRKCDRTYKLNDNLMIEAGTPVFVNLIAIHYNEKIYPEPKRWNPERFRNVSDGDNLNYTFLPFGEGPRFCIGKRYGMMQVRAALAKIVEKFRIEPGEPYNVPTDPYSVMLAPKGGGTVKFVPR